MYDNRKTFRISAPKRSGHHAVVYWLEAHFSHPWLVNDCEPNVNPFDDAREIRPFRWDPYQDNGFSPKMGLIVNYEDRHIRDVFSEEYDEKWDLFVGTTKDKYDVIVLRDPYNYVASRLAQKERWINKVIPDVHTPVGQKHAVALWKEYAREYLGETSTLKHNPVKVNYNQWFIDSAYRKELSARFGLEHTDKGKETVRGVGGSSFEGLAFDGKASDMGVLQRYTAMKDDPDFRRMTDDPELRELGRRIFPELKL